VCITLDGPHRAYCNRSVLLSEGSIQDGFFTTHKYQVLTTEFNELLTKHTRTLERAHITLQTRTTLNSSLFHLLFHVQLPLSNIKPENVIIRGATALTNLGPAEQPPLAVFPDCTRRYWVDMWSAHRIPQLHVQLSKPDCYFFIQVTTQFIRSRG
jgi:hypothetical protein